MPLGPHETNRLYKIQLYITSTRVWQDVGLAWAGKAGIHGDEIHYLCGPNHPETEPDGKLLAKGRWKKVTGSAGLKTWDQWLTTRADYVGGLQHGDNYTYIIGTVRQIQNLNDTWPTIWGGYPPTALKAQSIEPSIMIPFPQVHQGYTQVRSSMGVAARVVTRNDANKGVEVWTEFAASASSMMNEIPFTATPGWRRGDSFDDVYAGRALLASTPNLPAGVVRYAVDLDRYSNLIP